MAEPTIDQTGASCTVFGTSVTLDFACAPAACSGLVAFMYHENNSAVTTACGWVKETCYSNSCGGRTSSVHTVFNCTGTCHTFTIACTSILAVVGFELGNVTCACGDLCIDVAASCWDEHNYQACGGCVSAITTTNDESLDMVFWYDKNGGSVCCWSGPACYAENVLDPCGRLGVYTDGISPAASTGARAINPPGTFNHQAWSMAVTSADAGGGCPTANPKGPLGMPIEGPLARVVGGF